MTALVSEGAEAAGQVGDSAPGGPRPRGGLLRHRDFRLLWLGETASGVGTAVSGVVLPLIAVVSLHASAFEVGALAAAEWLPWLLIGLPAGVLVDRSRCRPLMIWCDIARAVLIATVPIAAAAGVLTIGQLLVVALTVGMASVLFQVAYTSYLPSLLHRDDLIEGNAKLQGTQALARVVGPSLGGLLVQAFRAPFAIVANAIGYLASAAVLLAIRHRETPRVDVERRSVRADIADGARFVLRDRLLRVLTIAPATANFFFTGYQAIVVLFLVRTVDLSAGAVGLLMGLSTIGAVIGAAIARRVAGWIGTSRAVWLVTLITSPFALLIPLTSRGAGLAFFLTGSIVMFVGVLIYNVTIGSFRQAYCPPEVLGRVVATMRFVLFGIMPLGALFGGTLAGAIGTREAVWVLTAGGVVPGLILLFSPLRGMRDLPAAPAGADADAQHVAHTASRAISPSDR
jgi:MFS family permease